MPIPVEKRSRKLDGMVGASSPIPQTSEPEKPKIAGSQLQNTQMLAILAQVSVNLKSIADSLAKIANKE